MPVKEPEISGWLDVLAIFMCRHVSFSGSGEVSGKGGWAGDSQMRKRKLSQV